MGVILSAAKDLALRIFLKMHRARFFASPCTVRYGASLRMTVSKEFFRSLLEKPISEDFHDTTVGGIVQALLDGRSGYTWRVRDGVLNVSHRSVAAGKAIYSIAFFPNL